MAILSLLKNLLRGKKMRRRYKISNFIKRSVLKKTKKVHYQKLHDKNNTMFKMLNKLQLSFENFKKLNNYCKKKLFSCLQLLMKKLIFLKSLIKISQSTIRRN